MDTIVIVAIVMIVLVGWLAWEAYTAPVKSDDYNLSEEERKIHKEYTDEDRV